jgi:hypothetical protein
LQFLQNVLSQIATNGDGTIKQAELEQAVTNAGGTKQAADALYSQLDPNNTGSVSVKQAVQNFNNYVQSANGNVRNTNSVEQLAAAIAQYLATNG